MTDIKNIKAILWDLDGTLQDSYNLILASFRHCTKQVLGADIPDVELMAKVGQPLEVQMLDWTQDPAVVQELVDVYRAHNIAAHDELLAEFPGVREALERLQAAGYKMGVVTSKRHWQASVGMDIVGITPYLDFLVGADDCTEHKPKPGPILVGCQKAGFAPEECMYVGDSPFDVAAANAAGCTSVAALWGMFSREVMEAEHPDYLFENVTAFADMMCE